MNTDGSPRYAHDCDKCNFLETSDEFDLYFCPQGGHRPTVIARYGDDGPDYKSGIQGADFDPHLGRAKRLSQERGLLILKHRGA